MLYVHVLFVGQKTMTLMEVFQNHETMKATCFRSRSISSVQKGKINPNEEYSKWSAQCIFINLTKENRDSGFSNHSYLVGKGIVEKHIQNKKNLVNKGKNLITNFF